ncbi:unnamed protein product, partial [Nesidiocoris tenuis]
ILAAVIVFLHYETMEANSSLHLFLMTATFGGFLIITIGTFLGYVTGNGINRAAVRHVLLRDGSRPVHHRRFDDNQPFPRMDVLIGKIEPGTHERILGYNSRSHPYRRCLLRLQSLNFILGNTRISAYLYLKSDTILTNLET